MPVDPVILMATCWLLYIQHLFILTQAMMWQGNDDVPFFRPNDQFSLASKASHWAVRYANNARMRTLANDFFLPKNRPLVPEKK